MYEKAKENDKIIEEYTHLIEDHIVELKQPEVLYINRGAALQGKGEYTKAIRDYDKAIEIKPYAPAYYNRGKVWQAKGEFNKAIRDYGKAIEIKPNYAQAYNNRGNVWYAKGETTKAIGDFDKAISLKPDFALAYTNRGNAWDDQGEDDKAIADYGKAIEFKPDHAEAYTNRGIVWKAKGEYAKAIHDYNKAIETNPDYTPAYDNLAWLLATCPDAKIRNGKQAVAHALKLIELFNGILPAYQMNTLAAAYAEDGQFDKAVKMQQQAMEVFEDEAEKKDFLSRLELYRQKKPCREELKKQEAKK